jgi:hypothetical protein
MAVCDGIWSRAIKRTAGNTEEMQEVKQVLAWMSPLLMRLLHAYPLLYDLGLRQFPALWELRPVLDQSWDELRTVICPLRELVGETNTALERLFFSISHQTRVHELHPDPTLGYMAHGAMWTMTNLTTHQLPKQFE